jgi:hypothetical protein
VSIQSLLEYMGIDTDNVLVVDSEDDGVEVLVRPPVPLEFINITIAEPEEGFEFDCS